MRDMLIGIGCGLYIVFAVLSLVGIIISHGHDAHVMLGVGIGFGGGLIIIATMCGLQTRGILCTLGPAFMIAGLVVLKDMASEPLAVWSGIGTMLTLAIGIRFMRAENPPATS